MIYNNEKESTYKDALPGCTEHPHYQEDYTTEQIVLQALTSEEQLTRWRLREITGVTDIRLRNAIANLQSEGIPIINLQDGRGYKLTHSYEELAAYKDQERGRAYKILRKINAMHLMEG